MVPAQTGHPPILSINRYPVRSKDMANAHDIPLPKSLPPLKIFPTERGDGKHQVLCRESYNAKSKYNWSVLLDGTKAIW